MLISVGRGKALNEVSPEEGERIMRWVFDLSQHSPFAVKTTEAPSYRRIAIETMRQSGKHAPDMKTNSVYHGFRLVVDVRDDGAGGATMTPGGGLAGLRDRAEALDGVLFLVSPPGGPTVVHVEIPLGEG